MGHRSKTEIDLSVLTEFPEVGIVKLLSQICYDGHRGAKSADNVLLDKVGSFFFSYPSKSLGFYPPSKLIYRHYYMLGLAGCSGEWPDQI